MSASTPVRTGFSLLQYVYSINQLVTCFQPLIVCHEINEKSPLWELSEEDINQKHFEIIVILEGIVESTGMICQARTSYLNTETKWVKIANPIFNNDRMFYLFIGLSIYADDFSIAAPLYR